MVEQGLNQDPGVKKFSFYDLLELFGQSNLSFNNNKLILLIIINVNVRCCQASIPFVSLKPFLSTSQTYHFHIDHKEFIAESSLFRLRDPLKCLYRRSAIEHFFIMGLF